MDGWAGVHPEPRPNHKMHNTPKPHQPRCSTTHKSDHPTTPKTERNRRDFFRFSAMATGNNFFLLGGPQQNPRKYPWKRDYALFGAWAEGHTGYPLVVR